MIRQPLVANSPTRLASATAPIYMLAALSGCAALSHEVLWTRRLVDLLGASAASTTRVFACFFLGLSLGSACGPWLVRKLRRPWRCAAALEAGIALAALPALFLPDWTAWLWPALGTSGLLGFSGQLMKWAISMLVILPPALLMGLTLPVFAAAFLRGPRSLRREGIRLYAANTAGGIAGAWLPVALLLPNFGLLGGLAGAIGLNLVVSAGCYLISRRESPLDHVEAESKPASSARQSDLPGASARGTPGVPWLAMALAAFSGGGVLASEVIAMHQFAQVVPAGMYIPMAVLMVVIAALAISAALAPRLLRSNRPPEVLLSATLKLAAVCLLLVPMAFLQVTSTLVQLPAQNSAAQYVWQLLADVAMTIGPAMIIMGSVLPLIFAWVAETDPHGRNLGWLLAANGLGGWLGAELTLAWLLPAAGMHVGVGILSVLYGAAAIALAYRNHLHLTGAHPRVRRLALNVLLWCGLIWATFFWATELPTINPRFGLQVLDERAGRDGSVAVVQQAPLGRAILMQNEYVLGSTVEWHPQRRQAQLPLALHADPKEVVVIGLATGITAGGAVDVPAVERVRAVELSRSVVDAAREYFAPYNRLDDVGGAKLQIIVEDGRTYVAALSEECDVVMADFFLPWRSGVGRLYSLDHFQATRRALRPGGIFCQWLPMYQLTLQQYRTILATLLQVYPRVYLFRNTLRTSGPGLALICPRDGRLDWETLSANCARMRESSAVRDPFIRHREGIALMYLTCIEASDAPETPITTLNHPRLEFDAMQRRVIVGADGAYVFAQKWIELENEWRLARDRDHSLPDWVRTAAQAGLKVIAWDYLARLENPRAQALVPEMIESLPAAMVDDAEADHDAWHLLEPLLERRWNAGQGAR